MHEASLLHRGPPSPPWHTNGDFNDSADILALHTACGTFGFVCLTLLLIAFLAQLAVALRRLYTRPPQLSAAGVTKGVHTVTSVRHLGLIMDGNRRFGRRHSAGGASAPDAEMLVQLRSELCSNATTVAKGSSAWLSAQYHRFLKLLEHTAYDGHRSGGEKLLEVLGHCMEAGVRMVTVYAFSTDNWRRAPAEVDALMALFFFFFQRIRDVARREHIFVRFVSTEPELLPAAVLALMTAVEEESRLVRPRRLVLNICVSYSGQSEVVKACNRLLARRLETGGDVSTSPVTREEMRAQMLHSITQDAHAATDAADVFTDGVSAEPELIVRTSGEQRVSDFMLFECAYSEFVFLQKTWPEVTREDLLQAFAAYAARAKRMGH